MASAPPPGVSFPPGPGPFDPLNQTTTILLANGQTPAPLNTWMVTQMYIHATSLSILYGSQLGACFMMLCVVLAMTPRVRFRRLPTLVSIAALTLNTIRMVLLAVYFTTTWMDLYLLLTGDTQFVSRTDLNTSVAATVLSVPVTVLILAALCVQAWSMMRLWPVLWKAPAAAVSLGLVVATVVFNMWTTVVQANEVLHPEDWRTVHIPIWARQAYLGLITASICWFCFLFNVRLVMHMWTNRSILPSLKGLKAMDVLVITNGILMLVPVVFAALEFFDWDHFEPGSMTQTSVILVLPLGTLVAQRLANPGWFDSSRRAGESPNSTGATGSSISRGGMSGTTAASTVKRPLLWSARSSAGRDGVHRGGQSAVSTHIAAASDVSVSEKARAAHHEGDEMAVDRDLARIASGEQDLERGHGGVRVDYGIERTEERVPTGSS